MKTKNPESKNISQLIRRLQPRYILLIAVILILLLFISAFFELNQTRREIHHIMQEEAATLMEAISRSGVNAIQSFYEIERLLEEKLFAVAYQVQRLEQHSKLTQSVLAEIVAENQIHRINIFDSQGKKILSNVSRPYNSVAAAKPAGDQLQPLFTGEATELALGLKDSRQPGAKRFAVAVKRKKGGAILANVDAEAMLKFRKSVGIGRLMQDISDYEGIEYIVLQDYDGIILASRGLTRMNSVQSDSFLMQAFQRDLLSARISQFNDREIFEAVQPFKLEGAVIGLFRIGFKTDHLTEAGNRIKRRMIIMSVVMGLIILIVINFVTINQNYHLVNEAYRRIRTYSRNILEQMADAVVAIDRDKRITLFNSAAAELFQLPAEQVLNRSGTQVIPADVSPLFQALESGETVHDYEKPIQLNQRRVILAFSTSVLKDEKNEIDAAFVVIKNLTETHRLEETVRRKEKLTAMGQLASGLAHEIRNPLNAIGMLSQRLNKEFLPTSDTDEYLNMTRLMVSEVRRIDQIIQQFLRFARPPKLDLAPTNLIELLEAAILLFSVQAQEQGIQIIQELKPLPAISIDRNQLQQVFINLLKNSLEAVEGAGEVRVKSETSSNREICIEITDTGKGMSVETVSKIFNLYFTTKPAGTGLGLSLVHQIISQHNGRIEVDSEIGQGTVFRIYLPV